MESTTPAHQGLAAGAALTLEPSTREMRIPLPRTPADRCVKCEASLATDQRYCVDCGQPRAATRVPFTAQPRVA